MKQKIIYFTGAIIGVFLTTIITVNILGYNVIKGKGTDMDTKSLILIEAMAVLGCLGGGAISIRIYKKIKP